MEQSTLTSDKLVELIENQCETAGEEHGIPSWEDKYPISVLNRFLGNAVSIIGHVAICYLQDGVFMFELEAERIPPAMDERILLFDPSDGTQLTLKKIAGKLKKAEKQEDERVLLERIARLESDPTAAVSWKSVRRSQ